MKKLFIILFSGIPVILSAQYRLEARLNLPRVGDEIIKQQVEYKDPGRSGENVLWDFGKLQSRNDEYELSYILGKDSLLTGIEHRTRYYYALSGDSLLLWGYENYTTLMENEQPELLLRFPVNYGDSTFCYYNGNGKYCDRLKISALGTIESKADACGMMILPSGDTLKNVLRVRTVKRIAEKTEALVFNPSTDTLRTAVLSDSIEYRLANDTLLLGVETCRWYAKGYRYPIFETVKSITDKSGEEQNWFDTAFFYPPDEHSYLEDDEENLALLEEELDDPQNADPWAGLTYNFYPNPVADNLSIEIYMPKSGQVRMQLTSRTGLTAWMKDFGTWDEGIHAAPVYVGGFPTGEYVLSMWFDDYLAGGVILKR